MRATIFWQSIRIGIESLLIHPLRTLLSTSGIVMGVLALVATFSVIDGVDVFSRRLIERETSVQDVVLSTRRMLDVDGREVRVHHAPVFTLADWRSARSAIPHSSAALLTVTGQVNVGGTGRRRLARVTASTENLPDFTNVDLQAGRFFTDIEVQCDADVVVLGNRLAAELAAPHDPLWLVGRTIRVGDTRREVLGVLAPLPGETDLVGFVPIGRRFEASAFAGDRLTPVLRVKSSSVENVPDTRDAVIDWIAQRFPGDREALEVTIGLERLQRTQQAMLLTKMIFGLLVLLMLAIGGIGVMNVLLASVAERTREIGVRKAVGARGRDVLLHFLAESSAIAMMGSAAGAMLGVGVAYGAAAVFRKFTEAPIYPVFTSTTVVFVIIAAVSVGIAFGTYPARVAARLTPIEAIQRE
jgi:putative ABC transport system permease protein